MGEERTGKRKLFLFFLACCLSPAFWIIGCAPLQQLPTSWVGEWHLSRAKIYLEKGDYDESLTVAREVLMDYYQTTGGGALFHMGLLYALPENRAIDYRKSLEYFERVLKEFPQSPLGAESRIFVSILRDIAAKDEEIKNLIGEVKDLEEGLKEGNEDIEALKKRASEKEGMIDSTEKALRVAKGRIKDLESRIGEMQASMETLKRRMERLKKVDLGIEEQKRGALP